MPRKYVKISCKILVNWPARQRTGAVLIRGEIVQVVQNKVGQLQAIAFGKPPQSGKRCVEFKVAGKIGHLWHALVLAGKSETKQPQPIMKAGAVQFFVFVFVA